MPSCGRPCWPEPPIHDAGEAAYQARFALSRLGKVAQAVAPHALLPAPANTSGNWFSPAYFCVNANAALVETVTTDTGCTGTQVVAERVSAFSVGAPPGSGPVDAQMVDVGVTLKGPSGGGAITLSGRLRLGGGLQ